MILGLTHTILKHKNIKDSSIFFNFVVSLNKIKENKIHILKELYTIYTSTDASELYNSVYFFKAITDLPKEYKNVTIRDLVCVMLFMRGELEYSFVKNFVEKTLKLV